MQRHIYHQWEVSGRKSQTSRAKPAGPKNWRKKKRPVSYQLGKQMLFQFPFLSRPQAQQPFLCNKWCFPFPLSFLSTKILWPLSFPKNPEMPLEQMQKPNLVYPFQITHLHLKLLYHSEQQVTSRRNSGSQLGISVRIKDHIKEGKKKTRQRILIYFLSHRYKWFPFRTHRRALVRKYYSPVPTYTGNR